jgi:hypothetical protein
MRYRRNTGQREQRPIPPRTGADRGIPGPRLDAQAACEIVMANPPRRVQEDRDAARLLAQISKELQLGRRRGCLRRLAEPPRRLHGNHPRHRRHGGGHCRGCDRAQRGAADHPQHHDGGDTAHGRPQRDLREELRLSIAEPHRNAAAKVGDLRRPVEPERVALTGIEREPAALRDQQNRGDECRQRKRATTEHQAHPRCRGHPRRAARNGKRGYHDRRKARWCAPAAPPHRVVRHRQQVGDHDK